MRNIYMKITQITIRGKYFSKEENITPHIHNHSRDKPITQKIQTTRAREEWINISNQVATHTAQVEIIKILVEVKEAVVIHQVEAQEAHTIILIITMVEGTRRTIMVSMVQATEIQKATRNHKLLDIVDLQEIKIMVNKIWTLSHLNFSVSFAYFLIP